MSVESPNKAFTIYDEDHDEEPNHSLFLKNERTGSKEKLLDFDRHVDVSWAPSSDMFFVNNYAESNESNCVVKMIQRREKIDIFSLLQKILPKGESGSDHLYVTCTEWNGEKHISI